MRADRTCVLGEASAERARARTAPGSLIDSKVRLFDLTVNDYDDYEADYFPGDDENRCKHHAKGLELVEGVD